MGIVLCLVYGSFTDIFRIFAYHYVSYLVMELGGVSRDVLYTDVLYTDVLCTACKRESSVLTLSPLLSYLSYLFVLSYFSYVLYFSLVSTLLSLFFAELFLSFFSDLLY